MHTHTHTHNAQMTTISRSTAPNSKDDTRITLDAEEETIRKTMPHQARGRGGGWKGGEEGRAGHSGISRWTNGGSLANTQKKRERAREREGERERERERERAMQTGERQPCLDGQVTVVHSTPLTNVFSRHTYIRMYICIYVYMYIHNNKYVCVYIYTYIYTHTQDYIYMYI